MQLLHLYASHLAKRAGSVATERTGTLVEEQSNSDLISRFYKNHVWGTH